MPVTVDADGGEHLLAGEACGLEQGLELHPARSAQAGVKHFGSVPDAKQIGEGIGGFGRKRGEKNDVGELARWPFGAAICVHVHRVHDLFG